MRSGAGELWLSEEVMQVGSMPGANPPTWKGNMTWKGLESPLKTFELNLQLPIRAGKTHS
jgi:hypothetical protein